MELDPEPELELEPEVLVAEAVTNPVPVVAVFVDLELPVEVPVAVPVEESAEDDEELMTTLWPAEEQVSANCFRASSLSSPLQASAIFFCTLSTQTAFKSPGLFSEPRAERRQAEESAATAMLLRANMDKKKADFANNMMASE